MGNTNCTRKSLKLAPIGRKKLVRRWPGVETLRQNKKNELSRVIALVSGNSRVVWNGCPIITEDKGVLRTSTDCYKVSVKTGTIFKISRCKTKTTTHLKYVKSSCFGVLKRL
jgi:hypothetical protein